MSTRCRTPFIVKDKMKNETLPVPCGKCPDCRARRASGWSFRLMQEAKKSISAYFITLTYDTKHIPITRSGYLTLRKRDIQLFYKRLRKAHEGHSPKPRYGRNMHVRAPIRYYTVGEYGGQFRRPHYHAILFNADIKLISPAWELGEIHYGTVTPASVGYTLKYVSKGGIIPQHINDDREREFSLMSKGLGLCYITPQMIHWHKANLSERMYCNIDGGKKIAMPRYYKNKIYHETERKAIGFHVGRAAVQKQLNEMHKSGLFVPDVQTRRRNSERYYSRIASVQKRKERAALVKI